MRAWKETYLPILEILNSIFLGFVFFFSVVDTENLHFQKKSFFGNYPEILVLSLLALLAGYLLQLILESISGSLKDMFLMFLILVLLAWNVMHFQRQLLLEIIFHSEELRLEFILVFMCMGFLVSGLKEAQMGGFLLGAFLFSLVLLFFGVSIENYKTLHILLLISAMINVGFRSFLRLQNQFLPSRRRRRSFKLFQGLYSSFLVLFIINLAFTTIRGFSSFQMSAFLFLLSYLLSRTFSIYRFDESYFRNSVVFGRNILIVSFLLFAGSFVLEAFNWILYLILGACLGYFKPEKPIQKLKIQTLLTGISGILLLVFFIQLTKYQFYWIHMEALLAIPVFLPFLRSSGLEPINIHLPIILVMLFSAFLFKTPTVQSFRIIPTQKVEVSPPIPYLLSDLWKSQENFRFIESGLPYDEIEKKYPNPEELDNKIPVIGDKPEDPFLNYYKKYLERNSIPYYVVSTLKREAPLDKGVLNYQSFPGFRIYYGTGLPKPEWNEKLNRSKYFSYILSGLETIEDFRNYPKELEKMERYAGYELRREIGTFRTIIAESINQYCRHYHLRQKYSEVLNCLNLEMQFGSLDKESLDIAYTTLNFTAPSYLHLELLHALSGVNQYRIPTLKKIYPIYNSAGNHRASIQTLEKLINHYKAISNWEEVEDLEKELTRTYLEADNLEAASSVIRSWLYRDRDSLIWNRLRADYEEKMSNRRRAWIPPPTVDTTEIE